MRIFFILYNPYLSFIVEDDLRKSKRLSSRQLLSLKHNTSERNELRISDGYKTDNYLVSDFSGAV